MYFYFLKKETLIIFYKVQKMLMRNRIGIEVYILIDN